MNQTQEQFTDDWEVCKTINQIAQTRSKIDKWFYFKSNLWNSIRSHIATTKNQVLFKAPENSFIVSHRGTGLAITLKDYNTYQESTNKTNEPDHLQITIWITYVKNEDRHKWEYGNTEVETKYQYRINIPTTLIKDFTKLKFNKWIDQNKQNKHVQEQKEAIEQLTNLIKKYPQETKQILNKLKNKQK